MSGPSAALVPPSPSAPIPDVVDLALHFSDLVSPSQWLMWVIDQVCGVNPSDWLTEHFSGDWEKMSTASSALENLAAFQDRYAEEVGLAQVELEAGWEGEAAAAATAWFGNMREAVAGQADALRAIARDVDSVAQGMKSTQDAIVSLISVFLDWAIIAAASAAAAAASSWTVVGGLIGGGSTAFAVSRAVDAWMEALRYHSYAVTAVDALVGLTAGYVGAVHGFEAHPLPAGTYDNRQVGSS